MTDEFGNELADFICPICNLLYYGDKCLHRYPDIILFQAAEIERLRAALGKILITSGRMTIYKIARAALEKRDYKAARGVLPWQEGDEPAEDAIRRLRGGSS